ncbi:MAG: hypothetical protein ACYCT2_04635 [Thermoplasmataceae archaeon]
MVTEKYPPELRVFPNSTFLEHQTKESRLKYIKKDLANERFLRGKEGTYWLRSLKPTHRISPYTIALFRFQDVIIGEGIVVSDSVEQHTKFGEDEYEGYIMFDQNTLTTYKREIPVKEINYVISPLGKTLGMRNAWTRVPLSYHEKILALQNNNLDE